ncbi:hypothetical protein CASFOL_024304 [Castilleja foliolosa]|uniref:Uncharacterized protein n=1 Tax=Castilleja foliolosa TaxID=1961234 RepID=A0ABD3CMX1_9LAMI
MLGEPPAETPDGQKGVEMKILSRNSVYNDLKASNVSELSSNFQFDGPNSGLGSTEMFSKYNGGDLEHGHFEYFADSGIVAVITANKLTLMIKSRILGNYIKPLTELHLVGICNLRQSSQQAEGPSSQGMEALQQLHVETVSSNSLGPHNSGNVADYMRQMAIAMSKLATLKDFLQQVLTDNSVS